MKILLRNLGVLKQAEFSLGDLTILCGENNTGKTYATYALFGFLYLWRRMLSIQIKGEEVDRLLSDGVIHLDLSDYIERSSYILSDGCERYVEQLPMVFAAPEDRFNKTKFQIILDTENINLSHRYERRVSTADTESFSLIKHAGSAELIVTLLFEKEKVKIPKDIIMRFISDTIKDILFDNILPNPFIASAERTGSAIFRKELNFARNRLLEEMGQAGKNLDPIQLLFKVYQDYPLPVKENVDFTRDLETVSKKKSFIVEEYPEVLTDFADIIGGEYTVTRNDELYFLPRHKRIKLTMDASSSAVRSLLDIGFYLRHVAQKGDLLIVDEPELNLHPENQRRIARLFARLVNLGIKVFLTTHSDYIIKELNTLIMLNRDKPHLKRIAKEKGYRTEELISSEKIKVYIAEESLIKLDGNQKKTKCQTLTLADIDPDLGIEARSFDTTIETMNRIQEEIIWGEE